jgi:hypothetical protein
VLKVVDDVAPLLTLRVEPIETDFDPGLSAVTWAAQRLQIFEIER